MYSILICDKCQKYFHLKSVRLKNVPDTRSSWTNWGREPGESSRGQTWRSGWKFSPEEDADLGEGEGGESDQAGGGLHASLSWEDHEAGGQAGWQDRGAGAGDEHRCGEEEPPEVRSLSGQARQGEIAGRVECYPVCLQLSSALSLISLSLVKMLIRVLFENQSKVFDLSKIATIEQLKGEIQEK